MLFESKTETEGRMILCAVRLRWKNGGIIADETFFRRRIQVSSNTKQVIVF